MMKLTLTSLLVFTFSALASAGQESISRGEMKQSVVQPPTCPINWTGFYIGGHFGYGWGNADTDFNPRPSSLFTASGAATLEPDPDGVLGGGQIGYNFQMGHFVVGPEADFSWSDMGGTHARSPIVQSNGTSFGGGELRAHQDTNWFGTVRLRLGVTPVCRLLLYATGGMAYGDVNYSANTDFRNLGVEQYPAAFRETSVGWTAGGGAEFALTKRWSVKLEYLYYDLGDESRTANGVPLNPPFRVHYDWETAAHTVRAGLNFKF